ncbi:MAG: LamG domain-containing protein, partial [Candidatus Aenigmarchaeota archaeon]|nr:LamG domain-containing protein [Candidatus Aenigmarchaeota archaeon]
IVYVDGVEKGRTAATGTIDQNTGDVFIGSEDASTLFFDGTIDEVVVHSRALNAAEVKQHYTEKRALFSEYIPGQFNSALALDGNASYVSVPPAGALDIFSQLTIEGWINMKGGRTDHDTILIKDGSYGLWIDSATDKPVGRIWVQGGSGAIITGTPITRNDWHHVAVTADGAELKMYTDGQLTASSEYFGQIPFTTASVLIGTKGTTVVNGITDGAFNGALDYVALYKVALGAEQIKEIYEAALE